MSSSASEVQMDVSSSSLVSLEDQQQFLHILSADLWAMCVQYLSFWEPSSFSHLGCCISVPVSLRVTWCALHVGYGLCYHYTVLHCCQYLSWFCLCIYLLWTFLMHAESQRNANLRRRYPNVMLIHTEAPKVVIYIVTLIVCKLTHYINWWLKSAAKSRSVTCHFPFIS